MSLNKYPDSPGFQQQDTSYTAAESMNQSAPRLRQQCVQALALRNMTADEVAKDVGASILSIRPRITELKREGLLHDTGERRKNSSGRNAIVWSLRA